MRYVVDTNVLLDFPEVIHKYPVVILSHVLRELEKHKQNSSQDIRYKARQTVRILDSAKESITYDLKDYSLFASFKGFDPQYVDNLIISACNENGYGLITNDLLLKQKALLHNIPLIEYTGEHDDYTGYMEVELDDEQLAHLYQNQHENMFGLLVNQYLIIKNKEKEIVDLAKWTHDGLSPVKVKGFTTQMFGKFKPLDVYQTLALDSLQTNQMTMLKGKAGSGKSMIALNYIMHMIEKGKYDKLICFVNPINSRNSVKIGYLPGDKDEKLMGSSIGAMLSSKFGDENLVYELIKSSKLILMPISNIRGFDTTGMKAIVWIIESQNMDVHLMKLAVQRIGEDGKLIIDGDYNTQVDSPAYEGINNGMRRVSEVFRGQDFYGEVELPNIYRSKIAAVAEQM